MTPVATNGTLTIDCTQFAFTAGETKTLHLAGGVYCGTAGVLAVRGAEAYRHDRRAELACRLESVEGRIEHNGDLRLRMYSDYAAGVIDKAQYAELVRAVDARLQELKGEKAGIERESAQLDDVRAETWEQTLARYRDAEGLERVMVVELIDRVLVGEGGDIEVVFRFGDPVAACASKQEGVA